MTEAEKQTQRTRWEHGHLSVILQELPRLLSAAFAKHDYRLLGLALDLAVPPLALLVSLLLAVLAATSLAAAVGFSMLPLMIAGGAFGLLVLAVFLAWYGWERQVVYLLDLLSVPFYVLLKIPLYVQFWTRRQKDWGRTDREP